MRKYLSFETVPCMLYLIYYLLVPLHLIDIKLSFELYLFIMTGQSINNTYSLLSVISQHVLLFYSLDSEVQNAILATNKRR